jgi:hypothetical protein
LDAVRIADQIRPGHIRLGFSETHFVEINGDGAAGILARLSDHAVNCDGTPLKVGNANLASPLTSESPVSPLPEDRDRKA